MTYDGQVKCMNCGTVCFDWNAFEGHPCGLTQVTSWETTTNGYRRVDTTTKIETESKMANVVICDRCGELTEARVVGKVVYAPNPEKAYQEFAICPSCSREAHQFLTGMTKPHRISEAFDPDAEPEPVLPSQKETSSAALEAHVNGNDENAYDYDDPTEKDM